MVTEQGPRETVSTLDRTVSSLPLQWNICHRGQISLVEWCPWRVIKELCVALMTSQWID